MKIYFQDFKQQIKEKVKMELNTDDYYLRDPYFKYDEKQIETICAQICKKKYYIDSDTGKEYISNPHKKCIAYFERGAIKVSLDDIIRTFTLCLLNEIQYINRGYPLKNILNF